MLLLTSPRPLLPPRLCGLARRENTRSSPPSTPPAVPPPAAVPAPPDSESAGPKPHSPAIAAPCIRANTKRRAAETPPLGLRPRPLGQRLGPPRKPNPLLQFVFVHFLPRAENKASLSLAGQSRKLKVPPAAGPLSNVVDGNNL
jgi:hypothetical protein